jgi:DNA-binding CsgD family transcriptional regulator
MAGKRQLHLTEGQKDCLRLVDNLLTSKEIARKLGISPFTVDQRLDAARRKLQATNRKEAARLYLAAEARSLSHQCMSQPYLSEPCLSEPIVYDPAAIADFDFLPLLSGSKGRENKSAGLQNGSQPKLRNAAAPILVRQPISSSGLLLALLKTALVCAIMIGALTMFLAGLNSVLT